ncbi:hypothetical protein XENOCAPTIV_003538 [Xenoophorus captivus]|uniref:RRM domain-containing protein n=1 Tax=Xenoophorus captivus TaxID=1517983 RepID=A0ABV0RNI3_9TELE
MNLNVSQVYEPRARPKLSYSWSVSKPSEALSNHALQNYIYRGSQVLQCLCSHHINGLVDHDNPVYSPGLTLAPLPLVFLPFFSRFWVYGDVQRVKILYNKKDSALIQLSDGNQAQLAMSHLNGQKVFGKVMRVTLSKHQTVALPREGLDDQLLTKGKMVSVPWKKTS